MSGKTIALRATGIVGWLLFLYMGWLIARNSVGYLYEPEEMLFLEQRAPASEHWLWRWSLYTHVGAGILALVASVLQFFRGVLRRWPALHRNLGRIYAHSMLWVVCPTGAYLALSAKGGFLGQSGFMTLSVITFAYTWQGVAEMRAGRMREHVRWMIRSFAMLTSAMTFRVAHLALQYAEWDYDTNYITSIWLSVVLNAAVGEVLARMIRLSPLKKTENQNEPKTDPALLSGAGYP